MSFALELASHKKQSFRSCQIAAASQSRGRNERVTDEFVPIMRPPSVCI